MILAIVVLGGMGSQIGVVLAAIVLIGCRSSSASCRTTGCSLSAPPWSLIMVWRPGGLLAHREPTIRLASKPPPEAGGTDQP